MPKSIKLKQVDRFVLCYTKPFSFRYTLWKPSHFPTDLEIHTKDCSWRTFRFGQIKCGVKLKNGQGKLSVCVFARAGWNQNSRSLLIQRLRAGYGLDEDLRDFLKMAKDVPQLLFAVKNLHGMRISCPESLFEIAVISLLLQNTTINRSIQMIKNLFDRYGSPVTFDGKDLFCFFSPDDILKVTEMELRRNCRLGYRAKYLPRFAEFFVKENDDALREMPAEDILIKLQAIPGVGPYTAGIIASHALRDSRTIALDVWNRKLLAKFLLKKDDADPKIILRTCNKLFGKYAGLAVLYLIENHYRKMPMSPLSLEDKRT